MSCAILRGRFLAGLLLGLCFGAGCGGERAAPPSSSSEDAGPFVDMTEAAGIDFVHDNGARGEYRMGEIMCGGGAFLDYDGDGLLDVYLVQSAGNDSKKTSRLYRNLGDDKFQDVTAGSGTALDGVGMGAVAADVDRDGDVDLYVTRVGADVFLRNLGDGTFRDETRSAGLGDPGFGSSASWLDIDGDGWLDLYVARYVNWTPLSERACRGTFTAGRDYCSPTAYEPTSDLLYRNRGDGTFENISAKSGIASRTGYGLGVCCSDFDRDGKTDIYVANDQSPAFLWRNLGNGQFTEAALDQGCAFNGESIAIAGMGIAAEDFDRDGDFDLFVTNIRDNPNLFLRRETDTFVDVSLGWGEYRSLRSFTGFGVVAFDQDLDGELEMVVANGAVAVSGAPKDPDHPYSEPDSFLRQGADGRFVDVTGELGAGFFAPDVSRGLATGDIDNDGDLDLLICRNGARPRLLRNDAPRRGHWLRIETEDATGHGPVLNAVVTVEAGTRRWTREVRPQGSYLVSGDPRPHVGVGEATEVRVQVRWPDGSTEISGTIPADQAIVLRQGSVAELSGGE